MNSIPDPNVDASAARRLLRGEVLVEAHPVPGWKTPQLVTRAVINLPPEQVWRAIDQSDRYSTFLPRVKESAELMRKLVPDDSAEDGTTEELLTRIKVHMPFPLPDFVSTTRARHTVKPGREWIRAWVLEEGAHYRRNQGNWLLRPLDDDPGRTYAVYTLHVETKMPIPKRVENAVQGRAMSGLIEAIREEARRKG